YISQDGTNWAAVDVGRYDSIPNTLYVGLVVCSVSNGNLATGVFSHVQITGGDGGAPVVAPAAPAALLASGGENVATLNWQSSFGATSYTIGRATTSGGPYTTIASGVTTSSYIDTTVTNGTTYYYVVNAVNSAGTSGNSPEDIATPQAPMVNVAVGGAPNSDDYNTGSQGPAMAFDSNSNTKWYHGAAAPAWIQYDFGSGVSQTIKRYTITSASDVPQRDPAAWQFQGSNDGSTWTTLDTQSNQVFPMRQQTLTYNVAQPAAYRYYRLNVTANSGGSGYGVQLSELGLFTDQGRTILNGTYRVLNYKSGKALDLSGGNTGNGTQTVQWTYGTANSQKWTFTDQGNGQYQVMNVASGTVLDVSGGSTSDLANLIIWPWSGATNQQWQVIPCGGGCYRLTSVKSGKVADVTNGSTADGATVIQYHINGGTNQEWSISVAP
ncbi:MAG TPA: RICIN domain-containing protein, partial [Chthoniobacterales bacterium]